MNVWFLLYAAGALQAALLALTLSQRRSIAPANQLLTFWMALLCVDLGIRAWDLNQPTFSFWPIQIAALLPFLHGSLFYLYVRAAIDGRRWRLRDLWHALGFALAMLAVGDLLWLNPTEARAAYAAAHRSGRFVFLNVGLFVYSLSYLAAALLAIQRHRQQLRATRSDSHPDALRWLVVMAASQCVIWGIAVGAWVLPGAWPNYRWIYVAVAAWVLLVGYFSLLHSAELPGATSATDEPAADGVAIDPHTAAGDAEQASEDPRFDEVAERLQALMAIDHLYREATLSSARLARRSGYPEYLVSAVINRRFGCPFWDYVNRFRVDEAARCLRDPSDTRTALDIAYACGFSSKSTFNAAFKRFAGETPSACRARAGLVATNTARSPTD